MFAAIGFIAYGSFRFGTARWLWRPLVVSGSSTHVQHGILYKDSYRIEIK